MLKDQPWHTYLQVLSPSCCHSATIVPISDGSTESSTPSSTATMELTTIQTVIPKPQLPKLQQDLQEVVLGVPPTGSESPPDIDKELSESGCGSKHEDAFTNEKNSPLEAWYYNPNSEEDPEEKDPTLPHHYNPDQQVAQEHLQTLGVLTWTDLQTRNYKQNELFEQVKTERGYKYEEVVTVAPDKLADYEQKKIEFFKEHLHEHEEIRFILEGGGYEDVRDFDGHWIRIHITKGVLIVLPKGMYHRFTLDDSNYLKAVLLYHETPCRIQYDRNPRTDIMEVREQYKAKVLSQASFTKSDLSAMMEVLDDELEALRVQQEQEQEVKLGESNKQLDPATPQEKSHQSDPRLNPWSRRSTQLSLDSP